MASVERASAADLVAEYCRKSGEAEKSREISKLERKGQAKWIRSSPGTCLVSDDLSRNSVEIRLVDARRR